MRAALLLGRNSARQPRAIKGDTLIVVNRGDEDPGRARFDRAPTDTSFHIAADCALRKIPARPSPYAWDSPPRRPWLSPMAASFSATTSPASTPRRPARQHDRPVPPNARRSLDHARRPRRRTRRAHPDPRPRRTPNQRIVLRRPRRRRATGVYDLDRDGSLTFVALRRPGAAPCWLVVSPKAGASSQSPTPAPTPSASLSSPTLASREIQESGASAVPTMRRPTPPPPTRPSTSDSPSTRRAASSTSSTTRPPPTTPSPGQPASYPRGRQDGTLSEHAGSRLIFSLRRRPG